ncbi:MAG: site-specific integrase [Prevotella sp.]|jgi:site-specific recombinase XerD|nr:site-specific integrase [Prevotella sp.]
MNILNIRIVFDRKGETKSNPKKLGLVHIEVLERQSKRKRYIYTGVKILPSQYSAHGGFSVKNHPNAIILKSKAFEVYNKVEAFIHSDKCTCIDDIDKWDASDEVSMTFLEFFEQEMYKKPIKGGTLKTHKTLLLGLVRFGKIKYFKDITYSNIADFDVFLRQTLKSQPILYKRHNTLSSYIKEAKRRKYVTENPYDEFKIKKGKSKDPVVLNESEIKKLIDYKPASTKIEKVRDMFLFQCMTGLAFVDMQNFSKDKINYVDNEPIINASRVKTEESYIIPLFSEAKEILEKYDYCLPKISNQKYNDYIKVLAEHVGIDKKLTSHTARHTYGSYLINKGVPVAVIQRAMGHAKITQTMSYAKLSTRSIKNEILEIGQNNRFVS